MDDKLDTTKEMLNNLGTAKAVVFSFDTTGSMSPCIAEVRKRLRDLAEMMFQDIPGLKIGLIAHGDYCDGDNCITVLDLTNDIAEIMSFITDTPNTGGGDMPECYEFVLHRARSMSWPDEGGAFVLIGDATPHEQNPNNLDWREEANKLKEKKVQLFAMQCLKNPHQADQNRFWEEVASVGGTPLLVLESFGDSAAVLGAAAYAAAGEEALNVYKAKMCSVTPGGVASYNLADNVSKLESYTKSKGE